MAGNPELEILPSKGLPQTRYIPCHKKYKHLAWVWQMLGVGRLDCDS